MLAAVFLPSLLLPGLTGTLFQQFAVPTAAEIGDAIEAGRNAREAMRRTTDADRERDCSLDMAVSYGLDSDDEREVREDYYSVRGLK